MKVYVAGSSKEAIRALSVSTSLEHGGVGVTSTWPQEIIDRGDANRGLGDRARANASMQCLRQVEDADALLLLAPTTQSAGCWVELGYAICFRALNPSYEIIVAGDAEQSVFCSFATATSKADREAVEYLISRGAT